jgi:hypothetical protein
VFINEILTEDYLYKIVYKMDGLVHTVVETVKELGCTLRDCFEDKTPLIFQLT